MQVMSFIKQINSLLRPSSNGTNILQVSGLNNVIQVRTATKKVSGSKTNKNDSAGRRLGPKAYEGHFVQPGQIIMRQRGTKIHPGENVDIGKDHTIFALEPGYVRFYYDPFHPLRKYVGVALKKDLSLPTPHFSPRVRRFGYEVITDPVQAQKEEDHMSRKEFEQQPELQRIQKEKQEKIERTLSEYKHALLNKFKLDLDDNYLQLGLERLLNISQLTNNGQTLEDAEIQTTYNYIYDLKLAVKRGEISAEEESSLRLHYTKFIEDFDKKVTVDAHGNICSYISAEDKKIKRDEILNKLSNEFVDRLHSSDDKRTILDLIETPGIYAKSEQESLKKRFLTKVLPVTVPGSIIESLDPKSPPKGVIVSRIFDVATRQVKIIGRPKEAYIEDL